MARITRNGVGPAGKAALKRALAKKAVNGSQKGAAFERTIAKQISLWVSGGTNPDLLWRSASSGARSTVRRKATGKGIDNQASDIAPTHVDAEPFSSLFILECKHYKVIQAQVALYDWPASMLAKWWAKARIDAVSVGKVPLLVAKENQRPALLVCPDYGNRILFDLAPVARLSKAGVYIVRLDHLVQHVPFAAFRSIYLRTLPGHRDDRPASGRPPRRRVPLEGV